MKYFSLTVKFSLGHTFPADWNFTSSIRGLFGRTLKKISCLQHNIYCKQCSFHQCLYKMIFEPDESKYEYFHPYIIHHDKTENNNIIIKFTFLSFTLDHINALLLTILKIDRSNIKVINEIHPLRIISIHDQTKKLIYHNEGKIERPTITEIENNNTITEEIILEFVTPLRLKFHRKLIKDFVWEAFYRNLTRRIDFFNDKPTPLINYSGKKNNKIEVYSDMYWKENYRKSLRQKQKMSLGGLIGTVRIKNLDDETGKLLRIGEIIHVGKQTTFGLGKYNILE